MITMTSEMKRCAEACSEANRSCLRAIRSCLTMGKDMDCKVMMQLLDCAQMCATMEQLCMSGLDCSTQVAEACAKACQACAKVCGEMASAEMLECAESCRCCADCCQKMCVTA